MKCPLCQVELRIIKSRNVKEKDKEYLEQDLSCVNKQCKNYGSVVKTLRDEIG